MQLKLSRKYHIALKERFGNKVLYSFIVVIVVVLSTFTLFAVSHEEEKLKDDLREKGEMLSEILARGSMVGVYAENKRLLSEAAESVIGQKNVIAVSIYNIQLKTLYAKSKAPFGEVSDSIKVDAVNGLSTAQAVSVVEKILTFEFLRPIIVKTGSRKDESLYLDGAGSDSENKVIGYVSIVLSKDIYSKEIYSLLMRNAFIMLTFILSSIIIVYLAVKRVTRPLENLTESVKALGEGLSVKPVPVETGDEIGNLAATFNTMVVARGKAEESLRQSEQRFRLIAETIDEVFWIADVDLIKMLYVSPGYERVWGRSRESLFNKPRPFLDAVHSDDRGRVLNTLESQKVLQQFSHEYRIIRPDGGIRSIWDRGYPILDETGQVACYVGVAQDITERKKNEEALKTQARVLESMAEGVSAWDEQGIILLTNPAFDAMFGYERGELVGKPISIINNRDNGSAIADIMVKLETEDTCHGEFINRKKDGTKLFTFARFKIGEISDKKCWIAVQEDITLRKQAEEALLNYQKQLFQAQKMEAIANLAGGIAHDFRNYVTAVLGYVELVDMEKSISPQLRENTGIIKKSAQNAGKMISQLLSFARKNKIAMTTLNLNNIVHGTVKLLEMTCCHSNIMLDLDVSQNDLVINADAASLENVIINLACNAKDAMPNGGKVTIKTEFIKVSELVDFKLNKIPEGEYAAFTISDQGDGILAENIPRIFEPFYSTKEHERGTGLGLAMVYGVVADHNGYIIVDSIVNTGSIFTLYFPVIRHQIANRPEGKESAPALVRSGITRRILLVDDDKTVLAILEDSLKARGYEVMAVDDPVTAIDIFHNRMEDVDIVVSDLYMPLMKGDEFIRRAKLAKPDIKVIIITGAVNINHFDFEVDCSLAKPFDPDELAYAIDNLFSPQDTHP